MYEKKNSEERQTATYEDLLEKSIIVDNSSGSYTCKPSWLKVPKVHGERLFQIQQGLRKGNLHSICEEAKCPNISDCLNSGTATFLLLGDMCTRRCKFCHVKSGDPGGIIDSDEPGNIAERVHDMNLDYVVLTMVDRDDLPLGGAPQLVKTIVAIQERCSNIYVELLAGDFAGSEEAIEMVLHAGKGLDVFAHNLETVERMTPRVRDRSASYSQSLQVLKNAKRLRPEVYLKSGIMLGLGETLQEIEQCILDIRDTGAQILTIGQYLQPSPKQLSVKRYVHPSEFEHWKSFATHLGFLGVASGPLVRSSYRAADLFPSRR